MSKMHINGNRQKNLKKITYFFKLGFTPCKAEQQLRGMSYKKLKYKKIKAHIEGSTYLFVVMQKFIHSEPYVGWKKMKTYTQTNFSTPWSNIFLTVTVNKFIFWNYHFSGLISINCSNSAILTVEWSAKYVQN